ncbi:MAG: D-alanine--D-alanine ligase, partial [Chloroflexi bacterium]|nr:D-alanine--D-alanine ligase [Chloroflexota bacterium]
AVDTEKYEIVPIGITRQGKWLQPSQARVLLAGGGASVDAPESENGSPGTALVADPRAHALVTFDDGRAGAALQEPLDVVFPVLHGPHGEDGTVQGFLELANIPYVGAGVLGSALGMDKVKMKEVLRYHGLPVGEWVSFRRWQWREDRDGVLREASRFGYPCFVKPANLGSSVGISKVHDAAELPDAIVEAFRHDEKILVEEFVDSREIEVAVLGNHRPEASVPGEIVPCNEFYDYRAKYLDGKSELLIPAPLPPEVSERVRNLTVKVFLALECAGLARVDFFVRRDTHEILVNEINTLPGFTPISMYPKLWEATGISYGELIDRLIQLAIERWQERNTT